MDDFEKQLKRQQFRPVPPDWRRQILLTVDDADATDQNKSTATWMAKIRELLWPSPVAWSGLAAVWIVIAALRMATVDNQNPKPVAQANYAQLRLAMELKRTLEAETQLAEQPRTSELPKPRSHLRRKSVTV